MIRQFSVYNKETGLFTGLVLSTSNPDDAWRSINVQEGFDIIEGEYKYLQYKVVDGRVVEYVPPAPSADYEWNPLAKEWELRPELQRRADRRNAAIRLIATLEAQQQRAMRELLLDGNNKDARVRLTAIEERIADARQDL